MYDFILQALINNLLCVMHGRLCVVLEILLTVNLNLSLSMIFKRYKRVFISLTFLYVLTFPECYITNPLKII